MSSFDVILVGGGLANGLIATRLAALQPQARILIIEAEQRLGGNHTWSYHESDVAPDVDAWLINLARHSWTRQEVCFPAFRRQLETGYRTLVPDDLHSHVTGQASLMVMLGRRAETIGRRTVQLDGGMIVEAPCVIDGRGLSDMSGVPLGYQTFLGLEVELQEPHGLAHPIIMDADVTQHNGFRFVYSLPMSPTRLLIEDTYYADHPSLSMETIERRIRAYATTAGWRIDRIERAEQGRLPIVLDGTLEAIWPKTSEADARVGMRAGLFHQTTGYSLPLAAEVADHVARLPELTTQAVAKAIRIVAEETWSRHAFFRMLNRLLFIAARPHERQQIMKRFYGLDGGLIERFYAGRLTALDMARILTGRPPISIWRAIGVIDPRAAAARMHASAQSARDGRL